MPYRMPYCECTSFRRSDCLRGWDNCKSVMAQFTESVAPQWVAGRITFAAGLAFAIAVVALALSGCASRRSVERESMDRNIDIGAVNARLDFIDEDIRSIGARVDAMERKYQDSVDRAVGDSSAAIDLKTALKISADPDIPESTAMSLNEIIKQLRTKIQNERRVKK